LSISEIEGLQTIFNTVTIILIIAIVWSSIYWQMICMNKTVSLKGSESVFTRKTLTLCLLSIQLQQQSVRVIEVDAR
jgi:hypothetical protein